MADIRPFRGIRYSPSQVGLDLSAVVCPPFDVITPGEQQALYERDPRNMVRLELTPAETGDDDTARYDRAATQLRGWLADGTLVRESQPALYPCLTSFAIDGRSYQRRGLLALLHLEPWDSGVVRPHERTLSKAKADRLALLRACRTNLSPIWVVSRGPGKALEHLWEQIGKQDPSAQVSGPTSHTFWACTEPSVLEEVHSAWSSLPVYIADGHHRYETALNYRNEALPQRGDDAANFVLTYFVESSDPGLVVLGIHRLLRWPGGIAASDLRAKLETWFDIEESTASPEQLLAELNREPSRPAFAIWSPSLGLGATCWLKDSSVPRDRAEGHSDAWRQLDVAALHVLAIDSLFPAGTTALGEAGQLTYTDSLSEVQRAIQGGEAQIAILIRGTPVEAVMAVADAGDRMPEKSTFFYPKPVTGAVLASLEGRVNSVAMPNL
ncbi:MAG TPA: DUF1015 domain-containing protein [Chloroflexota bacterium]